MIDFGQNILEGEFDVGGIESAGLDEKKLVFLGEFFGGVGRHFAQVSQIRFVPNQHNHDVVGGVFAELREPSLDVFEGGVLGNVIDEERADGTAIICARDRSVSLLTSRIPDLGLDGLAVGLDAAGGELDADGGLGLEVELVAREPREEVALADAAVADQHHFVEIVVFLSGRHFFFFSSLFGFVVSEFLLWFSRVFIFGNES